MCVLTAAAVAPVQGQLVTGQAYLGARPGCGTLATEEALRGRVTEPGPRPVCVGVGATETEEAKRGRVTETGPRPV